MIGKATFGFVSKYQKGAVTVPTGQTQFEFNAADFTFHSTAYDWLVIARGTVSKGSGMVNGQGDYGFLLTAIDGQVTGGGGVDKLRLKVWDKATSAIVYDNQLGT